MTENILAFVLAAEVCILFYWWMKGGLADVLEIVGMVRKMTGERKQLADTGPPVEQPQPRAQHQSYVAPEPQAAIKNEW